MCNSIHGNKTRMREIKTPDYIIDIRYILHDTDRYDKMSRSNSFAYRFL